MANEEIRAKMRFHSVSQWQVAEKIGVAEQTVLRWLRTPLPPDRLQKVTAAIDEIIAERK